MVKKFSQFTTSKPSEKIMEFMRKRGFEFNTTGEYFVKPGTHPLGILSVEKAQHDFDANSNSPIAKKRIERYKNVVMAENFWRLVGFTWEQVYKKLKYTLKEQWWRINYSKEGREYVDSVFIKDKLRRELVND